MWLHIHRTGCTLFCNSLGFSLDCYSSCWQRKKIILIDDEYCQELPTMGFRRNHIICSSLLKLKSSQWTSPTYSKLVDKEVTKLHVSEPMLFLSEFQKAKGLATTSFRYICTPIPWEICFPIDNQLKNLLQIACISRQQPVYWLADTLLSATSCESRIAWACALFSEIPDGQLPGGYLKSGTFTLWVPRDLIFLINGSVFSLLENAWKSRQQPRGQNKPECLKSR